MPTSSNHFPKSASKSLLFQLFPLFCLLPFLLSLLPFCLASLSCLAFFLSCSLLLPLSVPALLPLSVPALLPLSVPALLPLLSLRASPAFLYDIRPYASDYA